MQSPRKLQQLGWLLLIWLTSVAALASVAATLKLMMRVVGLSG